MDRETREALLQRIFDSTQVMSPVVQDATARYLAGEGGQVPDPS